MVRTLITTMIVSFLMINTAAATSQPIRLIVDYISGDYVTHEYRDRYNMNVASTKACKTLARQLSKRTSQFIHLRKRPDYIHQVIFTCVDTNTGQIASSGIFLQIPYSTDGKNQPCVTNEYAKTNGGFCLKGFASRTVFIGHSQLSKDYLHKAAQVFENPTVCLTPVEDSVLTEACRVSMLP